MKQQDPWGAFVVSGVVLLVCYALGGCCVFVGLDLGHDGKTIYVPQVVAGVGFFVVPTLLIAGLFIAHLLGFRPGPTPRDKLRDRIAALGRELSPIQNGDDAVLPASWTPVSRLPDAIEHLGEKETTFKYTNSSQRMVNLALCAVCCLGGVIFLIGLVIAAAMGRKNMGFTAAIVVPIGLALLAGGIAGIIVLLNPSDLRVIVCEKGLVRVEGKKFIVFLWDDVLELYQVITDVYAYGLVHTAREYGFQLYRCDGEELGIYEGVNPRDVARLSDTLQSKVAERMLPLVRKQFKAGEEIVFGPLTMSKAGLSNGDEVIPWKEVEGVKVANGIIRIGHEGEWLSWSTVRAGEIPNLYVFLTLADQIIGVNR